MSRRADARDPEDPRPSEKERNRLLRRIDWRFLLPRPDYDRVACLSDGELARAARFAFPAAGAPALIHPAAADLAVASDPSAAELGRALECLRPGGVLYAEWRRRGRSAASVRRRLRRAGFQNVALYWPRPDPEVASPDVWLPLDRPEALRYDLDNRPPARNAMRAGARALRRLALLPQPRFGLARPLACVARKSDSGSEGVLEEVRESWTSWGLGAAAPRGLSMLLVTSGLRSSGKVVALVFVAGESRPRLAIKMPRVAESVPSLRREASILRALESEDLACGIPRVLASGSSSYGHRLIETAVTGLHAYVLVTRRNFRALAIAGAQWLSRLARLAGRPSPRPTADWWPRLAQPILETFEEQFGPAIDSRKLRECRRALEDAGPLPIVFEQRDFSPWNVLVDRTGHIGVVDWESAEPDGLPLLDLVYFLAYLGFSVDRSRRSGRWLESYRASRDPESATGAAVRESVDLYAAAVGLSPAQERPLRMLAWMVHARSEHRQLAADSGGPPPREALREALFFRLWSEELA